MTEKPSSKDFGKRRPRLPAPLQLPQQEPTKRSGHVALLVMGTIAVGSTAFMLMPSQNCDPPAPGMAAQSSTNCSTRSSSGSGGSSHWSSRSSYFSGDSSSHSSSGSSDGGSGGVTRGGFGSFAHGFGFSGGG
ncbi:hypothetical protein C2U70_26495 [Bradyrhizobium guangdongense]|uniref:hypothetical protein n=1 Tax=Bradyrhizobium guangdongense TaxID=1325090 RepID=UPI00112CCE6C|nr:hypothetical protein [Bradyrhizobium guangdongense]TPQ30463.1 hypothetical protein C2U70_26495 [Bradyrhizobium guangdongense]